jgi:hypothetical protein
VHVLRRTDLVRVKTVKLCKLAFDNISIKLVPMPLDVPQQHISDEMPRIRSRMTLHKRVQITKLPNAISDACVLVCHIERADKLAIVDNLDLMMIAIKKLVDFPSEKVKRKVGSWVVAHTYTACLLKPPDLILVGVEVKVVDDQVDTHTPFGSVRQLL